MQLPQLKNSQPQRPHQLNLRNQNSHPLQLREMLQLRVMPQPKVLPQNEIDLTAKSYKCELNQPVKTGRLQSLESWEDLEHEYLFNS
jgi:hypothetical protein